MLYLIGGPPRTGKTTLAQRIVAEDNVPFAATDALVHMLKHLVPESQVTDKVHFVDKAEHFYPFLEYFIRYTLFTAPNYLIEGDTFLPKHAAGLARDYEISACFLGFSEMTLEKIVQNTNHNDWVSDLSKEEQEKLPGWLVEMSSYYESECKKYGFAYFDLAQNFTKQLQTAHDYLLGK